MLEKKHLRCSGFVVEAGLSVFALLAAKGWIGEDDVECLRGVFEEATVSFLTGEGVAMPEVWFIDTVQYQIGKGDGIDEILFFPAAIRSCSEAGLWKR